MKRFSYTSVVSIFYITNTKYDKNELKTEEVKCDMFGIGRPCCSLNGMNREMYVYMLSDMLYEMTVFIHFIMK